MCCSACWASHHCNSVALEKLFKLKLEACIFFVDRMLATPRNDLHCQSFHVIQMCKPQSEATPCGSWFVMVETLGWGGALRPWKIIFAFIPPTDYCGGRCEFFRAFDHVQVSIWVEIRNPSIFSMNFGFRYNCHSSDLFMTGWVCFCFSLIFIGWALRSMPPGLEEILEFFRWKKSSNHQSMKGIHGILIVKGSIFHVWYRRIKYPQKQGTVTAHSNIPKDELRYRLFRNNRLVCGSGERALSSNQELLESTKAQV